MVRVLYHYLVSLKDILKIQTITQSMNSSFNSTRKFPSMLVHDNTPFYRPGLNFDLYKKLVVNIVDIYYILNFGDVAFLFAHVI